MGLGVGAGGFFPREGGGYRDAAPSSPLGGWSLACVLVHQTWGGVWSEPQLEAGYVQAPLLGVHFGSRCSSVK